jgi:hypothetical protein
MNLEFIKTNKSYFVIGIVAILAILAAFAVGRYTVAAKTITITKTVEVEKEVIKTVVQVVEKRVYIKAVAKDIQKDTTTITKPDGTIETHIVYVDRTKIDTASSQQSSSMSVQTIETIKEIYVDKEKIVEANKDWHLALSIGAGARIIGEVTPQLGFGLRAERRIIGPFFVGLDLSATTNIKVGSTPPLAPPINVIGSLVFGIGF